MDRISHCYIVLLDLCQPDWNYELLNKKMKSFKSWGRLTESAWAVVTPMDAIEIRDALMRYMAPNDRILVVLSGKSAAWNKLFAPNDWVRKMLVM